jgi:hypothetical protein
VWTTNGQCAGRRTSGRHHARLSDRRLYIVSGSGTAFIDGTLVNGRKSTNNPDGGPNGPGCGGGVAVGSRKIELKAGDVLIVPPGVIHGWFDIPDHVDYLSFRPSHGIMKNGWINPTIAPK